VIPEELLRCLLDSRGQSAAASGQQATLPTRIRALEALRKQGLSVTELADRIGVTRQTAYRALKPGREAGLIRTLEDEFALSCSGGAVLRAYHEICEEIDRDALVQLARSDHKQWILQALQKGPARKATLAVTARQDGGPSRTTIHRIIGVFVGDQYVIERAGAYELTELGRRLLEAYTEFRSTIAQALDKRDFLRWLPGDLDSFPVAALTDARIIRNSPGQPHNVLNAFTRVADTDLDTFRGISTIVSPTLSDAYRPVLNSRTQVSAVFPDDVLFQLHTDPEFINYVKEHGFGSYLRQGIAARDAELLFVPESLPLHLAICNDSRVMIAPAPSTGVTDVTAAAIDSTDPRIIEWATAFFESRHSKGRPPLRAFLDRTHAQETSQRRGASD
jgi:predicted transcriptional regulator